tara:strand:+ start:204 stop:560 length:357 start_codon:yes stop_codon:yes gene_type:complete
VIKQTKTSFSQWREAAVLDARALRGNGEVRERELQRLRQALESLGFFELQGHGIEHERMQDLFAAQRAFFALPDVQKNSLHRTLTDARGYNPGELAKKQLRREGDSGFRPQAGSYGGG